MRLWRVGWLLGVVCAGVGVWAAEAPVLTVTQDERAMEQTISTYLTGSKEQTVTERTLEGDDLILIIPVETQAYGHYELMIDTSASNRDAKEKVTERLVTLQLLTHLRIPAEQRARVLEAINAFVRDNWYGTAFIDKDNDLIIQWSVNVMKEGLSVEYVYDGLVRLEGVWQHNLSAEVKKILNAA